MFDKLILLFSLRPVSELGPYLLHSHNNSGSYGNNRTGSRNYLCMMGTCTFESMLIVRSTTAPTIPSYELVIEIKRATDRFLSLNSKAKRK